ncbi:MAG: hypothetical protein FWF28_10245, partial [Micrococcales bacterium]|nr:hypothetical protein [Micrococcales bacterium]
QLPWWIVTVNDVPAVTLPTTGGVGNTPWLVSGALLIVGAACFIVGGYLQFGRRRRIITVRV